MEQDNPADRPEQLRITAPPLYTPRRFDWFEWLVWCFLCLLAHLKWRWSPVDLNFASFLLRHPPIETSPTSNSNREGKTHVWVSARHGDLSEWAPYSGLDLGTPVLVPTASGISVKYFCDKVLHKSKLLLTSNNVMCCCFSFNIQGLAPKKMRLDQNTESGRI